MLNVSIVIYKQPISDIMPLVHALEASCAVSEVSVIDNSPKEQPVRGGAFKYIHSNKNLGYGKAHNIALKQSIEQNVDYHLVVNPDVSFNPDILVKIIDFMETHQDVALLMPKVFCPDGQVQYLCKLLPTPLDLFGRRFFPKTWMNKRMQQFELHQSGYDKMMNVPYLSGCFMFLRVNTLKQVGLFDERFFLYPEDLDLSRRLHRHFRTVFYPEVSIIHAHNKASYHNFKLLLIHTREIAKYFNKWGWFFDRERQKTNKTMLNELQSNN